MDTVTKQSPTCVVWPVSYFISCSFSNSACACAFFAFVFVLHLVLLRLLFDSALFSGYVAGGSLSGDPLHLSSFLPLEAATWFSRVHIVSCHPVALSSFWYSFFVDSSLVFFYSLLSFLFFFGFPIVVACRSSAFCLHVSGDGPIRLLVVVVDDESFRRLRFAIVVLLVPCQ